LRGGERNTKRVCESEGEGHREGGIDRDRERIRWGREGKGVDRGKVSKGG
jgi:hypothetical protein